MSNQHVMVTLARQFGTCKAAREYWSDEVEPLLFVDESETYFKQGVIILKGEEYDMSINYHTKGAKYWIEIDLFDLTMEQDLVLNTSRLKQIMADLNLNGFDINIYHWYDGVDRP